MADSTWLPYTTAVAPTSASSRHAALVRLTHWLTTLCFLALLLTGVEILISHPRFYWGEAGNINTQPLFKIPIPASRHSVPTGYGYTLPDQNGWSRALHFQAAWVAVFTALLYGIYGITSGHFRKNLLPPPSALSASSLSSELSNHLRPQFLRNAATYNVLQRLTYSAVIFILFPLVIWTGLAMSPAVASAFPPVVAILGGQQSARTIHFFVSVFLVAFLLVHIVMISLSGFTRRMRAMITGRESSNQPQERS